MIKVTRKFNAYQVQELAYGETFVEDPFMIKPAIYLMTDEQFDRTFKCVDIETGIRELFNANHLVLKVTVQQTWSLAND